MFDLPEKVTLWNFTEDGLGNKSWSAPVVADARIAYKREKVTDKNGDNVFSKAVFYTKSASLTDYSRVLLSESALLSPPPEASDVIAFSQTPSGAQELKKAWL